MKNNIKIGLCALLVLALQMLVGAFPAHSVSDEDLLGTWKGEYRCRPAQRTRLSITVSKDHTDNLSADIEFETYKGPVAHGRLEMSGPAAISKVGKFEFEFVRWTKQPNGYVNFNISILLTRGGNAVAFLSHPNCSAANLVRITAPTMQHAKRPPDPTGKIAKLLRSVASPSQLRDGNEKVVNAVETLIGASTNPEFRLYLQGDPRLWCRRIKAPISIRLQTSDPDLFELWKKGQLDDILDELAPEHLAEEYRPDCRVDSITIAGTIGLDQATAHARRAQVRRIDKRGGEARYRRARFEQVEVAKSYVALPDAKTAVRQACTSLDSSANSERIAACVRAARRAGMPSSWLGLDLPADLKLIEEGNYVPSCKDAIKLIAQGVQRIAHDGRFEIPALEIDCAEALRILRQSVDHADKSFDRRINCSGFTADMLEMCEDCRERLTNYFYRCMDFANNPKSNGEVRSFVQTCTPDEPLPARLAMSLRSSALEGFAPTPGQHYPNFVDARVRGELPVPDLTCDEIAGRALKYGVITEQEETQRIGGLEARIQRQKDRIADQKKADVAACRASGQASAEPSADEIFQSMNAYLLENCSNSAVAERLLTGQQRSSSSDTPGALLIAKLQREGDWCVVSAFVSRISLRIGQVDKVSCEKWPSGQHNCIVNAQVNCTSNASQLGISPARGPFECTLFQVPDRKSVRLVRDDRCRVSVLDVE